MSAPTVDRLRALVIQALTTTDSEVVDEAIDEDTFLLDVMDSVGLTALLSLIEEEWNLELDDDDIDPESFETLTALAGFVRQKLAAA